MVVNLGFSASRILSRRYVWIILSSVFLVLPPGHAEGPGSSASSWLVLLVACSPRGLSSSWLVLLVACRPRGLSSSWLVVLVACSPRGLSSSWLVVLVACRPRGVFLGGSGEKHGARCWPGLGAGCNSSISFSPLLDGVANRLLFSSSP